MLGSARRAFTNPRLSPSALTVMLLLLTACTSRCGEPSESPTPVVSSTPMHSPTPATPSPTPTPEPVTCEGVVAPALADVLTDLHLSPYFLNLPSSPDARSASPEVVRTAQVDAWTQQLEGVRSCFASVVDAPDDAAVAALFGEAGSCQPLLALLPAWSVNGQTLHALPKLDVDRLLAPLEDALGVDASPARQPATQCDEAAAFQRVQAMRAQLTLPPEVEPSVNPASPLFYRMRDSMAQLDPTRTTWSVFLEVVTYFNQDIGGGQLAPYFQNPSSDLLRKVYCSDRDLCIRTGGPCAYGQEVPLSDLRTYIEGLGGALPDKLNGTGELVAYGQFAVEDACRPIPKYSDSNKSYHNFQLSRHYDYSEYNVYVDYLLSRLRRAGADFDELYVLFGTELEDQLVDPNAEATAFWQVQLGCTMPLLSFILLDEALPTTSLGIYFENASFINQNSTGTSLESRFSVCMGQALCERSGGPCEYGKELPLPGDLDVEAGFINPLSRLSDVSMREVACRDIPSLHAPLHILSGYNINFVGAVESALKSCLPGEYETWYYFLEETFPDDGAEVITDPDMNAPTNMFNRTQGISFQHFIPWDWADKVKTDEELVGFFPESSLAYGSPMLECMSRLLCDATCGPCTYGDEYVENGRACRSLSEVHAGLKNGQTGAGLDKRLYDKSVSLLLEAANPFPDVYSSADLGRLRRLMDNLCPSIVSNPEECPPRDTEVDAEACYAEP